MSVRRLARKAATVTHGGTVVAPVSGLPPEFLDPDDLRWHADDMDLASYRDWGWPVPPEIAAAVCRLGRWKRLIAAAEHFAIERGWVVTTPGSELQVVDRRRLAAEGVPLLQWRKERLRLVGASMWAAAGSGGYTQTSEAAPF